jgi:hypothetical protein
MQRKSTAIRRRDAWEQTPANFQVGDAIPGLYEVKALLGEGRMGVIHITPSYAIHLVLHLRCWDRFLEIWPCVDTTHPQQRDAPFPFLTSSLRSIEQDQGFPDPERPARKADAASAADLQLDDARGALCAWWNNT